MEYSVYDLIRILLKKWYVILLVMTVVSAASVVLSQRSYQSTVENYTAITSETVETPAEIGTLKRTYRLSFSLSDAMQDELRNELLSGLKDGTMNDPEIASVENLLLRNQTQALPALSVDEALLRQVQLSVDALHLTEPPAVSADNVVTESKEPLSFAAHTAISVSDGTTLCLEVFGLAQPIAAQLCDIYAACLRDRLNSAAVSVSEMTQLSSKFTADPPQPTATAQLAQTVMRKPAAPPNMVKTAGTAAAYSFVFSCFIVLLFTFIRDSRKKES